MGLGKHLQEMQTHRSRMERGQIAKCKEDALYTQSHHCSSGLIAALSLLAHYLDELVLLPFQMAHLSIDSTMLGLRLDFKAFPHPPIVELPCDRSTIWRETISRVVTDIRGLWIIVEISRS
jgi:hypothetical protein